MKRILHLTLKKKWFDLIASGEKKMEYREIKPYWTKRFTESEPIHPKSLRVKRFDEIYFRNGYKKDKPFMIVEWNGLVIIDYKGEPHYGIILGKILKSKTGRLR